MKNFGAVFSFTFTQRVKSRGYLWLTVGITALCVLLPALLMPAVEYFRDDGEDECRITKVYVIDSDHSAEADYRALNGAAYMGVAADQAENAGSGGFGDHIAGNDASRIGNESGEPFCNITYETADSVEEAMKKAAGERYAVLLMVDREEEGYRLQILLPEETELAVKDADAYEKFLSQGFRAILLQKSGLSPGQIQGLAAAGAQASGEGVGLVGRAAGEGVGLVRRASGNNAVPSGNASGSVPEETDAYASAREAFSIILPVACVILLYFMILFYGQGTANSAVMEKTSKLMDLFLVSVKPQILLLGKVFATTACAILQMLCWVCALCGGFALGIRLVRAMNPQTDMALIRIFDAFGRASGMFTVFGVVLAGLLLAAGLLLYCSLASIGGAMAGRPEDLSGTNLLFILILVASYLSTILASVYEGASVGAASWQDWIPFTAVLITPAKILLGSISMARGIGSLAVILAASVWFTWIAGRLYGMMSLYKGNPPRPRELLKMLRQE